MTEAQNRLYRWLLARIEDPIGPTIDEMRQAMGLASKAGIHRILKALEEQGRVTSIPCRARSTRAVAQNRFAGIPSADLIAELQRRGEWQDAR